MSATSAALSFVVDVSLGVWLGVMAFFSFVGAPRAFAVVGEAAGAYVNDVFPRYYRIGVGLGTVALLAGLARGAAITFDGATMLAVAGTAVAVALAGYSLGILIPRMDAAGEDAFERYHRQSVVLNGVMMLAVAVALVGSHLPG